MSFRLRVYVRKRVFRNQQLNNSTNRVPYKGYGTVAWPMSTGPFPNSASIGLADWHALFPVI